MHIWLIFIKTFAIFLAKGKCQRREFLWRHGNGKYFPRFVIFTWFTLGIKFALRFARRFVFPCPLNESVFRWIFSWSHFKIFTTIHLVLYVNVRNNRLNKLWEIEKIQFDLRTIGALWRVPPFSVACSLSSFFFLFSSNPFLILLHPKFVYTYVWRDFNVLPTCGLPTRHTNIIAPNAIRSDARGARLSSRSKVPQVLVYIPPYLTVAPLSLIIP